jgi:retron-type reverse transcriptase
MKRITGLMKNICTMSNALLAYRKARRCKRYRPEVLEFEANREEYLSKARRELKSLTYTPGKYKVFKVWEPKERIIMALPFYDRVIQHMIVNYIEPIFEHQFIYHSYACRKGKVLTEPASS